MKTKDHLGRTLSGLLRSALAAIVTGMLIGCVSEPLERIPGIIRDQTQADIPIPRSFVQRNHGENWAYTQFSSGPASFRSWVGEYVGPKQVRDLVPWYKTQMLKDGWTHRQDRDDGRKRVLSFANAKDERALVIFDRIYDAREDEFETLIRVEVGPMPTEAMDVDHVLQNSGFQKSTVGRAQTSPLHARPDELRSAPDKGRLASDEEMMVGAEPVRTGFREPSLREPASAEIERQPVAAAAQPVIDPVFSVPPPPPDDGTTNDKDTIGPPLPEALRTKS